MRRLAGTVASILIAAAVTDGGPSTTILTPGAPTRTMGGEQPAVAAPTVAAPATAPPGRAMPAGGPGTAQRPTPDQSR